MLFGDVEYIKMSNMADITKKHNTEIYKDEQHGHHQKKIAQKYIEMNNMDITKKHNTDIYKTKATRWIS
jgi:hypothetical protein